MDGSFNYCFKGCGYCDDGIRRIRDYYKSAVDYDYYEFEEIFNNGINMNFDKYIIDEHQY